MLNRIVTGIGYALIVGALVFEAREGYRWKQVANTRGYRADVCYSWLAQPIAKDVNGKEVTRGALLDGMVQQALSRK